MNNVNMVITLKYLLLEINSSITSFLVLRLYNTKIIKLIQ